MTFLTGLSVTNRLANPKFEIRNVPTQIALSGTIINCFNQSFYGFTASSSCVV